MPRIQILFDHYSLYSQTADDRNENRTRNIAKVFRLGFPHFFTVGFANFVVFYTKMKAIAAFPLSSIAAKGRSNTMFSKF